MKREQKQPQGVKPKSPLLAIEPCTSNALSTDDSQSTESSFLEDERDHENVDLEFQAFVQRGNLSGLDGSDARTVGNVPIYKSPDSNRSPGSSALLESERLAKANDWDYRDENKELQLDKNQSATFHQRKRKKKLINRDWNNRVKIVSIIMGSVGLLMVLTAGLALFLFWFGSSGARRQPQTSYSLNPAYENAHFASSDLVFFPVSADKKDPQTRRTFRR